MKLHRIRNAKIPLRKSRLLVECNSKYCSINAVTNNNHSYRPHDSCRRRSRHHHNHHHRHRFHHISNQKVLLRWYSANVTVASSILFIQFKKTTKNHSNKPKYVCQKKGCLPHATAKNYNRRKCTNENNGNKIYLSLYIKKSHFIAWLMHLN